MGVYKDKKTRKYYIDYYDEGRRRRECVGTDYNLALKSLKARQGDVVRGKFNLIPRKKKILFETFSKEYLEFSKTYKKSYFQECFTMRKLLEFFKNKYLFDITPFMIEQYRKMRRDEGLKHSTI